MALIFGELCFRYRVGERSVCGKHTKRTRERMGVETYNKVKLRSVVAENMLKKRGLGECI